MAELRQENFKRFGSTKEQARWLIQSELGHLFP